MVKDPELRDISKFSYRIMAWFSLVCDIQGAKEGYTETETEFQRDLARVLRGKTVLGGFWWPCLAILEANFGHGKKNKV
jgi:hypothetical protein